MNIKCLSVVAFLALATSICSANDLEQPNIIFFLTDEDVVKELEANSRPIGTLSTETKLQ